ncbi:hypothetical protein ETI06_07655 [Macrococcoides goetzii]|nr:hypothetical protein [Macrococcus goetzii]TDM40462.1 hypothetical protein ETI10_07425 [Macrococcus goetzii]TDM45502.1 hypothetical protein ETI08_09035 [Macrococcus goetzii]TDM49410.1 hypothetical protein ETI06_07655 [Macrococcus goetzii]
MQFQITLDELKNYWSIVAEDSADALTEKTVPGNLVMHKVITLLNVPEVISNQATFKNEVFVDEQLFLDLFQANDMIEYKVTYGRQLKLAGTIQLK